ncbi:MAG: hypothetical protein LBR08_00835 [Bacteroidales bacterium]|jgi:hypothetical protein|nr:hypothetical protein [Bacteroidales bacterium]
MENRHQQSIPAATVAEALSYIDRASEILRPYLLSLTATDRQNIPKLGNKYLSFVEKTGAIAELNPQYCPPFFDLAEFKIDLADAMALQGLLSRVQQLARGIEDTAMTAGSEAYSQALLPYQTIKLAAKNNRPGAKVLYDELAESYPSGKRTHKSNPSDPAGQS